MKINSKKLVDFIRYFLIALSALRNFEIFFRQPVHLASFLLWILLLQLNWFAANKPRTHYLLIGLTVIVGLLSTYLWSSLPVFLIGLSAADMYKYFPQRAKVLVVPYAILGIALAWSLTVFEVASFLAVALFLIVIIELMDRENNLQEEIYKKLKYEEELTSRSAMLSSSLDSQHELGLMQERNRIARDLHDSIGHALSTVIIQLEAIAKLSEDESPKAAEMSLNLRDFTKSSLDDVRTSINHLKPKNYDKFEFIDSLKALVDNYNLSSPIDSYFSFNKPLWTLNSSQQELIYRAIQEFLSNSTKHSNADEIRIFLNYNLESIILSMQDNGQGASEVVEGIGLKSLKERVSLNNGSLQISTAINEGFRTRIVLHKVDDYD